LDIKNGWSTNRVRLASDGQTFSFETGHAVFAVRILKAIHLKVFALAASANSFSERNETNYFHFLFVINFIPV
jgi:hypothetical protein